MRPTHKEYKMNLMLTIAFILSFVIAAYAISYFLSRNENPYDKIYKDMVKFYGPEQTETFFNTTA